jgi:drug/metabolite transporter (DMT)-like permease
MQTNTRQQTLTGIAMALMACILWSFNFIVARGISNQVPPVSISFYRWAIATIIIIPIAWNRFYAERNLLLKNWKNILWASIMGIGLYSPLIYLAGHYSPAINLALLGTTSTPVFTFIIAAIFLKERIPINRLLGLLICIGGIVLLLSGGSWQTIIHFHFSKGDKWMLLAGLMFAVYNIVVRNKSKDISPLAYLFVTFVIGTLILLPMYVWEKNHTPPVQWNSNLLLIMLYCGAGASVAAFFCWNAAITRIGSARTAIFSNLIPVLASFEAVWLLGETVSLIQVISMLIVAAGLVLANVKPKKMADGR